MKKDYRLRFADEPWEKQTRRCIGETTIDGDYLSVLGKVVSEMTCDPYSQNPEEIYERLELVRVVQQGINSLPEKYQRAFSLRFGLDGDRPRSLDKVGEELEVTKERVRQMLRKIYYFLMRNKERAKIIRSVVGLPEPKEPPIIEYNHPDPKVRLEAAYRALCGRR